MNRIVEDAVETLAVEAHVDDRGAVRDGVVERPRHRGLERKALGPQTRKGMIRQLQQAPTAPSPLDRAAAMPATAVP
jgi:hypothetical protein